MTGLKYGQTAVSKEEDLPGRKDFDPQCSNQHNAKDMLWRG